MQAGNDREFELVLGNKQLLGLLFLTFVLLGVFFALGYAIGRTATPAPLVDASRQSSPVATSTAVRPAAPGGLVAETLPSTMPASSAAQPAGTAAGSARESAATPGADTPPSTPMIDPKPGDIYLQVTAVKRPEAELLVEVLTKKGFNAGLAPAPIENMFRVLVGPVHAEAQRGKLKSELEQAGFKPIPRRY